MVIRFNHLGHGVGGVVMLMIGKSSRCGLCPWSSSRKVGAYKTACNDTHYCTNEYTFYGWMSECAD